MSSAILSPCGTYRYRLDRECGSGSLVFAFFGINPSTADASLDDATVRKWRGFTTRNGGSRFIVGNLFAYRSTDPTALRNIPDPFGPSWGEHLLAIIDEADILVPCWGRLSKVPLDLRAVPTRLLGLLVSSGKPVLHFGLNDDGTPKHPLMLGYDTPLREWG